MGRWAENTKRDRRATSSDPRPEDLRKGFVQQASRRDEIAEGQKDGAQRQERTLVGSCGSYILEKVWTEIVIFVQTFTITCSCIQLCTCSMSCQGLWQPQ